MKKFMLFVLSLFLFTDMAVADDFYASVTSNKVVAGEPFELRLTYNGTENNVTPDLSVLQKDFQIYSNGTSMRTSYINGVVNQERSWIIGLVALKDGEIQIPAISAGKLSTKSITLTVLPSGSVLEKSTTRSADNTANTQAKFETEFKINKKRPYIKQEVTGTLIIKDYVGLEFTSEPVFINADNWTIKILQQPEVSQISNGREIKVIFSMFPLKAGEQEIPAIQWQAVYYDMENAPRHMQRFGFFDIGDFSMIRGVQKPVILQTQPQKIEVRQIPSEYGNSWWLPAKALTLTSKWDDKNQQFRVGETIAREIILSAAGVLDTELPELEFEAPQDMKQYPENPQFSLSVYKNEPIAQATYRIVYIPQKSGELTLPEISLKWFNTKNKKIETAVIGEQKINVAENPAYKEVLSKEKTEKDSNPTLQNQQENNVKKEENLSDNNDFFRNNTYLFLILAFVLGMLLSYILATMKRSDGSEGKTLNKIRKNLKNNDYRRLRDNLIKWGNENFPDFEVNNLNDLSLLIGEEDFSLQMQILNRILYADTKEIPNHEIILSGLKNRLNRRSSDIKHTTPLPKLYD